MASAQEIILITGGTGFAGSHLVELLAAQNAGQIHVTQYKSGELPDLPGFANVTAHAVDLTDATATTELIKKVQPTQIYHLASFAFVAKSFERGAELLNNNISLQINILEAVAKHVPTARILIIGSAEEYGMSESPDEIPITEEHPLRPINPYAVSKVAQDLLGYAYAKSYKLQILRVRPFNHIGERQTEDFAVPAFAKQIVAIERGTQQVLKVGNLEGIRDFTDVKDMAAAYQLVMEKGEVGAVYNIGSGTGVKMQEVIDTLASKATKPITIEVDASRLRPLDIPVIIANNERMKRLGWQPAIPLEQSLQRVLEYWRTV